MSNSYYKKITKEAVSNLRYCLNICKQLAGVPISSTPTQEGDYVLVKTQDGCILKPLTMAQIATITFVENYNTLNTTLPQPQPIDKIAAVRKSQGTKWLPGQLGGTFYPKGYYISTGTAWEFFGEFSYQATQADVDAGVVLDQFVSPSTLSNYSKWNTKNSAIQFKQNGVNIGLNGAVNEVDFVGNISATILGNKITVNGNSSSDSVILEYIAGETINGGRALYMNSDGKVYHLDITNSATYTYYVGISTHAAVMNNPIKVISYGKTTLIGSGWVVNKRYWIGVSGFLVDTPPLVAGLSKSIGVGIDTNTINVNNYSEYIKI